MIVALPDLAAVHALGRRIAAKLRPGDVVALSGDLGRSYRNGEPVAVEVRGKHLSGRVVRPPFQ